MKYKNLMFQLKFSDGTTDCGDYKCTKIDCDDLLIKYMSKHNLTTQRITRPANHVRCKTGVDKKWEKVIKPHKYNQSYVWIDLVEETLPRYFKEGARWPRLKCTKCKIVVSERSSKGVFTPLVLIPVYMCSNRSLGCIYLLCNSCHCLEINKSDNKRSTRNNEDKGTSNIPI